MSVTENWKESTGTSSQSLRLRAKLFRIAATTGTTQGTNSYSPAYLPESPRGSVAFLGVLKTDSTNSIELHYALDT